MHCVVGVYGVACWRGHIVPGQEPLGGEIQCVTCAGGAHAPRAGDRAVRPTCCEECERFWADIIFPEGQIDLAQVLAELHDYRVVLHEVSKVYCHVTGGLLSKPNTSAGAIIGAADEHYCAECQSELGEYE